MESDDHQPLLPTRAAPVSTRPARFSRTRRESNPPRPARPPAAVSAAGANGRDLRTVDVGGVAGSELLTEPVVPSPGKPPIGYVQGGFVIDAPRPASRTAWSRPSPPGRRPRPVRRGDRSRCWSPVAALVPFRQVDGRAAAVRRGRIARAQDARRRSSAPTPRSSNGKGSSTKGGTYARSPTSWTETDRLSTPRRRPPPDRVIGGEAGLAHRSTPDRPRGGRRDTVRCRRVPWPPSDRSSCNSSGDEPGTIGLRVSRAEPRPADPARPDPHRQRPRPHAAPGTIGGGRTRSDREEKPHR